MTTMTDETVAPLYSTLADDPEMADLVELYVAEMPENVAAMEAALAGGNLARIKRRAHQLRGTASGHGFPSISAAAGAVEIAAAFGDRHGFRRRANSLLDLCRRVRSTSPASFAATSPHSSSSTGR